MDAFHDLLRRQEQHKTLNPTSPLGDLNQQRAQVEAATQQNAEPRAGLKLPSPEEAGRGLVDLAVKGGKAIANMPNPLWNLHQARMGMLSGALRGANAAINDRLFPAQPSVLNVPGEAPRYFAYPSHVNEAASEIAREPPGVEAPVLDPKHPVTVAGPRRGEPAETTPSGPQQTATGNAQRANDKEPGDYTAIRGTTRTRHNYGGGLAMPNDPKQALQMALDSGDPALAAVAELMLGSEAEKARQNRELHPVTLPGGGQGFASAEQILGAPPGTYGPLNKNQTVAPYKFLTVEDALEGPSIYQTDQMRGGVKPVAGAAFEKLQAVEQQAVNMLNEILAAQGKQYDPNDKEHQQRLAQLVQALASGEE